MKQKELLKTCNNLINELEKEIKRQKFIEAIPILQSIYKQLKSIKIGSKDIKNESKIEFLINKLSNIDTEKTGDIKEIYQLLDKIELGIKNIKTQIIIGQTNEIINSLGEIKNILNIIIMKL